MMVFVTMINMDKIARTKITLLVFIVLLTIFTTIGLYYTMTVSSISTLETAGDSFVLNVSMVFAMVIAFMWMTVLTLFYEFKTDEIIKAHIHKLEGKSAEYEEFKEMLKGTVLNSAPINADVLNEGGITGHVPPKY
jgi:hypothetical protein